MAEQVRFAKSVDGIDASMLGGGFFEGWPQPPTAEEHLALLRGSTHVALAVHGDVVVGFANAVGDGLLSAYIPLLEVLPQSRGQGIGSRLIQMLLDEIGHLYMVDVMCDADVMPFYARLGFQPSGGASRRNYDWRQL